MIPIMFIVSQHSWTTMIYHTRWWKSIPLVRKRSSGLITRRCLFWWLMVNSWWTHQVLVVKTVYSLSFHWIFYIIPKDLTICLSYWLYLSSLVAMMDWTCMWNMQLLLTNWVKRSFLGKQLFQLLMKMKKQSGVGTACLVSYSN